MLLPSIRKIGIGIAVLMAASLALAGSLATNEGYPTQKSLAFDAFPAMANTDSNKYAVIIGIVYHSDELGVVRFADQDADSLYRLLTQRLGYPEENVVLLQNHEATGDNIIRALEGLAADPTVNGDAEVTVYYSGHGVRRAPAADPNAPPPGYAIVPYDYFAHDYRNGAGFIWDRELAGILGRIDAGKMWVMIDSCYAGGFAQPGITGENRVVTLSSRADEMSNEIDNAQRGVLTYYLVEAGLTKGLSVEQAFANAVAPSGGHGQTPQIVDAYTGNLFLK